MADAGVQGEAIPQPTAKSDVKLEDLFADSESNDEFSSTKAKVEKASSSPEGPASPVHIGPTSQASDPEVMRSFYQRLFPWRQLFQWLNHSPTPSTDFGHREFAFTLPNDAYLRYQAFPTADLLRKDVLRLMPSRFEIGPFITMAIKVVDVALRDDFGFKHIMWVYSGRRGAHAWVCDKKARQMDDQKRRAIAGYLELIRGGAQSAKKDPWEEDDKFEKLLQLLPDRILNESLRKKWSSSPGRSSTSKWADIDALAKTTNGLDPKSLLQAKQDIVLEYTYPRLDIEVSKHLNHLLKSPFVVHPGTGRVCVPIDTKRVGILIP
ncbi:hypothetical protein DID88_009998 [Monilinia fructigena]|uniref:DNA primase n=1 Tax=Monilinia fructigena TaxID=38457 RepID=A0A395IK86_9HELO|nr:hypothetical protein DID88_009998 [Monilinia fructigena]